MSKIDRDESVRRKRTPVSAGRSPMRYTYKDPENFHYRWVLDKDDRIATFLEAGYEFEKPDGRPVGDPTVNTQNQDGSRVRKSAAFGGLFLYLMKIPMEWYKEDQAVKQVEVDETEQLMQRPGKAGVDYTKDVVFKRGRNTLPE